MFWSNTIGPLELINVRAAFNYNKCCLVFLKLEVCVSLWSLVRLDFSYLAHVRIYYLHLYLYLFLYYVHF